MTSGTNKMQQLFGPFFLFLGKVFPMIIANQFLTNDHWKTLMQTLVHFHEQTDELRESAGIECGWPEDPSNHRLVIPNRLVRMQEKKHIPPFLAVCWWSAIHQISESIM